MVGQEGGTAENFMFINLALIIGFSLLLLKSTGWIVSSLKYFSRISGLGKFSLTGLVMALATSLPELAVAAAAAIEGKPNLVLGNVIGANIINLSLMVGLGAVLAGAIKAHGNFLKHDAFYAFLAGALPMFLLIDGKLGRGDGLALLAVYLVYQATILREEHRQLAARQNHGGGGVLGRIFARLTDQDTDAKIWWFILGAAGMIISAEGIVRSAGALALALNLPILVVGLFLVSLGTTLPELAFEIRALRAGESAMALGNLMGSVVANATLILGLSAVVRPIILGKGAGDYLTATVAYVLAFGAFYLFVRTKKRLDRWEGGVLVGLYLVFALVEIL